MKISVMVMVMSALAISCGITGRTGQLPKEDLKIAVLPFTARGPGMSQRTGLIAADRITTYLFVKKRIQVADRSQVNFVLHDHGLENMYFLSRTQLSAVADTLNASVILLGMIENSTEQADLLMPENRINVTLRFLDGKTGRILKIYYGTQKTRRSPELVLDEILQKAVEKL